MATKRIIITIGNSNTMGYGQLSGVPSATFERWTGTTLPTTYPIDISIPGIKCWTPKIPYATYTQYTIDDSSATMVSSTTDTAGTTVDQWLYVNQATTGQGQTAKITAVGGVAPWDLTVPAWTAPSTTNSTFQVITQSHSLDGAQTTTVLTKSANTTAFPAGVGSVGKWLVVISGAAIGQASRIASRDSTTQITLEDALTVAPASGDGIVILDGSDSVNGISTYLTANASFQDMRFYYDQSYTYGTGLDYPNWRSPPVIGPALLNVGGATVNYLPELSWHIRNHFSEEVYCIHLAVGSSRLSPYLGTVGLSSFSWFDKDLHNDWHPSSENDLYSILSSILSISMAQIVAAGDTPDIVGIFGTLAELEALDDVRADKTVDNIKLLRDSLRVLILANNWSLTDSALIPFVVAGVGPSATWTYSSTVNESLETVADDDTATGFVDTSEYTFITDGIHYDAAGLILLGQEMYSAWKACRQTLTDAAQPSESLLTLSTVRTGVRRRYERNGSGNDSTDTQVDQAITDALREIYNTMGTNAWFLRRVEPLTSSQVYPGTFTLNQPVRQLLRIENSNYPGRPVEWKGISYTSEGKIQVTLHDYTGGPYICHFMTTPPTPVKDSDRLVYPSHHGELLVVLSCKRLAESAGNISIATYFASESSRLWSILKREALRMDRFRNESLTTLPSYDSWTNGAASMGWI